MKRRKLELRNVHIQGDLQKRILRNFDRLESKRYQPIENLGCLRDLKYTWPGDMEGRTILSLALLQQTVERDAIYLQKTLDVFPERMNDKGYFGNNFFPQCDEQQLSSHGWVLRGLCEYFKDRKDHKVKNMIENIVNNYVVPTKGKHKIYPIDPSERDKEHGGYSGEIICEEGIWRLSTDIGCDFIFMDGVIQAADLLDRKDIYSIIDEMVYRFLEVDLMAIKAQTHATLTGLRGLIRYAKMTENDHLIAEVEKLFDLYIHEGSTENHMNYNWFGRPTHTEPCAIVDAFLVASQLWQFTGKSEYLEEAHKIYHNGLGHAQRKNGGFGLENCSGSEDAFLKINCDEAWWCCTMRGSEGLVKAAEYSFMYSDNTLFLPFFHDAEISFNDGSFKILTEYPYNGIVKVQVKDPPKKETKFAFFKPSWSGETSIKLNNKKLNISEEKGFIFVSEPLDYGDVLIYTFNQEPYLAATNNKHSIKGYQKIYQGPLLLGALSKKNKERFLPKDTKLTWNSKEHCVKIKDNKIVLTPINDIMENNYKIKKYCRQILWKI